VSARDTTCALAVALALVAWGCGARSAREATPSRSDACSFPVRALPEAPALDAREARIGARFDRRAAAAEVAFLDRFVRLRGNPGYEASLAALRARLLDAGFPPSAVRTLALGPERPTWRPLRASLALVGVDEADLRLHAFESERDEERLALLPGSPPVDGTFEVARPGEDARGKVLFGRASARRLAAEAERVGAVGILSHHLHPVAAAGRHPEAIGFQSLPETSAPLFGFSLSAAAADAIERRLAAGPVEVRARAEVERGLGRATTLVARLEGTDAALAPLALFAHVDEPGAVDNASGAVALAELAVALEAAIEDGALERPRRSIVFLFGVELESAPAYLEATGEKPLAALALDMVGASSATGAELLLERMPDPGLGLHGPLDAPSGWGAGDPAAAGAGGHFLSAYVELALDRLARGAAHPNAAPIPHRGHPFEGGSDHVPFLDLGIPAVLLWHFPDDAYHTSRDRAPRVSVDRMAAVAAAAGAVALGLASSSRADGGEALASVRRAFDRRLAAGEAVAAFARYYAEASRALGASGVVEGDRAERMARDIEEAAARAGRCAR
jgi:hypothetical protein